MPKVSITSQKLVFVAGAFTGAMAKGAFEEATAHRLKKLLAMVRQSSSRLFSSHEAEAWGKDLESPRSLVIRDMEQLAQCTHFVGYYGAVQSIGAFIELGYALSLRRPILLIVEDTLGKRSDFAKGLVECELVREARWSDDVTVRRAIDGFLS
jgi:hypothetical protein